MGANGGENFRRQVVDLMRRHVAKYRFEEQIFVAMIVPNLVSKQLRGDWSEMI